MDAPEDRSKALNEYMSSGFASNVLQNSVVRGDRVWPWNFWPCPCPV